MIEVIAEIGWNHLGDMSLAKKMIDAAAKNGANFAKFQSWSVSRLTNGPWDEDGRREIYLQAELSEDDHIELIKYCNKSNIKFMSSVFSIPDAELLVRLGVDSVKIPSFESRNRDLIDFCGRNFQKVYMSTGTSSLNEIESNIDIMPKHVFTLLHCVSTYPCEYANANLPRMLELRKLGYNTGYSDHIFGVESAKIAIGFGAEVIEKHFTVNRDLPGRDNKFAILPGDLKNLTDYINFREDMMINHGIGYQKIESESREKYSGRFNG